MLSPGYGMRRVVRTVQGLGYIMQAIDTSGARMLARRTGGMSGAAQ